MCDGGKPEREYDVMGSPELVGRPVSFFGRDEIHSVRTEVGCEGQTGVEGLPRSLIRFIGISEILGGAGLVLPLLSDVMPVLTPIAAIGLGLIMILAAIMHYRRDEKRTALQNLSILLVCLFVAYGRRRFS